MIRRVLPLLFLAASTYAQTTLSVQIGANASRSMSESYFWEMFGPVGCNASLTAGLPVTNWLLITPGIAFLWFPLYPDHSLGYSLADRLPPSNGGHGFHHLRLDLECRVVWPNDSAAIKPFLRLGGSGVSEHIGGISLTWPNYPPEELDPQDKRFWLYTLGIGTDVKLFKHIFLEPSLVYQSNGDDRVYFLLMINLDYVFEF